VPAPRLTALLPVSGADTPELVCETLASLSDCRHPGLGVAVAADPEALNWVAGLLGDRIDGAPDCFNKGWYGVPAFCLGVAAGEREAAVLNAAGREAWGDSDAFVALRPGDRLLPGYPERVLGAFAGALGMVGAVVADRFDGALRVFEEPVARDRLTVRVWQPPALAVARYALEHVGPLDPDAAPGEVYDLLLRLTNKFVVLHLPEPLSRVRPRPPLDAAESGRAWRRAVLLTQWRASQ
jgi:hypothetical protein